MKDTIKDKKYTELLINKSSFRAFVRHNFYIKNILKFVKGRTLDFGCGVGEVLKYLPDGSVGFDPNEASIEYCEKKGLNVIYYDPSTNNYNLQIFKNKEIATIIINHVLEHINSPKKVIELIFQEAERLKVSRIIIVVPCKKGYESDKTHDEYIDNNFFNEIKNTHNFKLIHKRYYPINNGKVGNYFRYQELVVVYENTN